MDNHEQWPRHEVDFKALAGPAIDGTASATRRNSNAQIPGYTLMVAGQRSGKTSFLRLLLDTSNIANTASNDQLASVARFVHGSSGHTQQTRYASVDVILDSPDAGGPQPVTLTLVDTPSLNFADESASQRTISDILAHVDSRFADSADEETSGNHHVHLCIYFLDPDQVIPPVATSPPIPAPPRARTGSLSQPESDSAAAPDICRAALPDADIAAIRRLSARVNVLPIVARADILTNERLAAVKLAIRSDLAGAGIGFGIFDLDNFKQFQAPKDGAESLAPARNGESKPGSGSTSTTPPATPPPPPSPSLLRLPYALISADNYSHSEGLPRLPPSRDDLVLHYAPLPSQGPMSSTAKLTRGKFTRSYRWGSMDVLDPNHCDFLHLRAAIFHHMKTLQKYTKEYLFEKFRMEVQISHRAQPPAIGGHSSSLTRQAHPSRPQLPMPRSRPVMEAPPHPSANARHPSLVLGTMGGPPNGDMVNGGGNPQATASGSKAAASSIKSQRTRSKKITVACNFCRSRKLKCDGGRPACGQCHKRSNPCDYIPHSKRRGAGRTRKPHEDDSGSDADSADDAEQDPSRSPHTSTVAPPHGNPNVEDGSGGGRPTNGMRRAITQPEQLTRLSPVVQPHLSDSAPPHYRTYQDLPPIATLPITSASPSSGGDVSVLPPIIIPDSHMQPHPQQLGRPRKRSSTTTSGRGSRSHYASKIVACNFCRARKTRCDGEHPACGACSRRSLPCNYVNESGSPIMMKRKSVGDSPEEDRPGASASSQSPPGSSSSHGLPIPSYGYIQHINGADGDTDMKRGLMDMEMNQPSKKMRFDS